jgi:hypothetical protein
MNLSPAYALAVWLRNAAMYRRTWMWNLLPNFFEPVFYLFSIGIGVGAYISQMEGLSYVAFIAPGLVCVAAMNGASYEVTYNIYVRLTFEKAYDAMLTTPIEPDDILAGEVLWAITRACIYGGCFFVWSDAISVFSVGAVGNPAYRAALCRNRHNILAADSQHRFIQLLLHSFSDAALFVLGCLLSVAREVIAWLAVGCRSVAAAPSCAVGAGRLQRKL